jgi:hypothetical protein
MRKKKLEAILILEIKINLIKNKIKTIKKREGIFDYFLATKRLISERKKSMKEMLSEHVEKVHWDK